MAPKLNSNPATATLLQTHSLTSLNLHTEQNQVETTGLKNNTRIEPQNVQKNKTYDQFTFHYRTLAPGTIQKL
ncbi:hypothetical protein AA0111_g12888 [Alternaria arborescens]|uniref:hypothetical protein n=1 Tax=Alternaria arborescens TaxID=156630 RepID=UPI001075220F|nr:hypothetical protein AA0111_g12888 [Alternaria arborescens]RYO07801.1 hypothetical protein AA0111_g12888 [Alternaria arborescens]